MASRTTTITEKKFKKQYLEIQKYHTGVYFLIYNSECDKKGVIRRTRIKFSAQYWL